jgi:hypothetical protein
MEEDGTMWTISPVTSMQHGGVGDDDARAAGLRLVFRHGMEAGTIVHERIVVATRSRDGGAVTWWQAVAEAVEQATQPPPRRAT